MKTIYPEYYSKFKCIASRCPDSCCIGWQICLDEKTAQRYLTSDSLSISAVAKQCMRGGKNSRYLSLVKGRCPYLDENNLCNVIKEKGEDFLCEVCYNHPRFDNEIDGVMIKYLSLSCPEASRLFCEECGAKRIKFLGDDSLIDSVVSVEEIDSSLKKLLASDRIDTLFSTMYEQMEYLDESTKEILTHIKAFAIIKKLEELRCAKPFFAISLFDYFCSVNCWNVDYCKTALVNVVGVLAMMVVYDDVKSIYAYVKEIEHSEKNEKILRRKVASPLFKELFN